MSLTIERVAGLQAEMDAGASSDEVLGRAGLARADYLADKERHLRAIADEVRGGRSVLLRQYQSAFLTEARRLEDAARRDREVAAAAAAPPEVAVLVSPGAAPKFLPSYLREAPIAATPVMREAPAGSFQGAPPPLQAPPMAAMPPIAVPASLPAVARSQSVLGKMTMMGDAGPRAPATPFKPAAPGTPAARSVTPSPPAPPVSVRPVQPASTANAQKMTMAVDGDAARQLLASMPFQGQRTPTPSPQPAARPPAGRLETGTIAATGLPNNPSGTVAVDDAPMTAQPLNPEEIRRHASAQADLKRARQPREVILGSWGFTAEAFAELDARWKQQFIADGESRSLWMSIYSARLSSG